MTQFRHDTDVALTKLVVAENVVTGSIGERTTATFQATAATKVIFTQPDDQGYGCIRRRRGWYLCWS
jgi:hypothetical protein